MEGKVEFKILWSEEEKGHNVKMLCGDVDGDGLPLSIYMAMLKALSQVETQLNDKPQPYKPQLAPEAEAEGRVIEDALKMEGGTPVKIRRIPDTPPPTAPTHPPLCTEISS